MIRLGGNHVYAVVYTKKKERMPRVYHNGWTSTPTPKWTKPGARANLRRRNGACTTSTSPRPATVLTVFFLDADDNAWEILSNPKGGYTWIFEQGDLEGRGHFERGFRHKRPDAKKELA